MSINFNTQYIKPSLPDDNIQPLQKYYYKMVAKMNNQLYSIYDGKTEYVIGTTLTETVKTNHGGGYYVYPTIKQAFFADVPFNKGGLYTAPRVLLVCMCWGESLEYKNGKIAWENLSPIKEMPMESGYLATKHAKRQIEPQIKEQNLKDKPLVYKLKSKFLNGKSMNKASYGSDKKDNPISELLKNENDNLEKEIKAMEKKLANRKPV